MNIRDLKYLIAIADHNHFGNAALACFVSQPALSMQIKKLEKTLGVQLIERTSKSALLTAAGKHITEQARDIIQRVEAMKEFARMADDPFSGEIHIGIIPTLAPYLLPHIIPHLTKIYPHLTIYLVEEQTANLLQKLKAGKLDGALLAMPVLEEDFMALPLFTEEFLLALPLKHPLAKQKSIELSDLNDTTLLLLEDGHCMRDNALEICVKANAKESKSFKATSLETLRHMVASEVGITLMPSLSRRNHDGIHYQSFASPKPTRKIGLIWRPTSAKSALLEAMVNESRKCLEKTGLVRVIHTPIVCQKS